MKESYIPKYPIFEEQPHDELVDTSNLSDQELVEIREAQLELLRQTNMILDKMIE